MKSLLSDSYSMGDMPSKITVITQYTKDSQAKTFLRNLRKLP